MITIIRRYYTYNINNSCVYQVTHDLTLRIEEEGELPLMLLPVADFRADLKITDSRGDELIVLSESEFNKLHPKTPLDILTIVFRDQWKKQLKPKDHPIIDRHRLIAIMLPHRKDKVYYEKVRLKWNEQFENRKPDGRYSKSVSIPIYIPRYDRKGESPAVYLSIKTNSKYEILAQPRITNLIGDSPPYDQIIRDVRHKVYRFAPTSNLQLLRVTVKIGLPKLVKRWASFGLFAAYAVPIIVVYFTAMTGKVPPFAYETLGGVIAFLVGLRVIVFHDFTLMEEWNSIHIKAVIMLGVVLFTLMFIDSHQDFVNAVRELILGKSVRTEASSLPANPTSITQNTTTNEILVIGNRIETSLNFNISGSCTSTYGNSSGC